jgi:signal transduction histidine kinase
MDPSSPSDAGPRQSPLEAHKSGIVTDLSHELRTLLGGIIGINELLLTTEQTAHQRQLAQTVEQSSKTLLTVLTDISELSRFEFGRITVDNEPIDLSRIAAEVTEQLSYLLRSKEIDFQTECSSLPPVIFADGAHVRHITGILLTNAFRCTTQGSVRLEMHGENETENGLDLSISITVHPIGEHDQIFLSTLSEPLKAGRKFDSRWLGLYLCLRLVELLKGKCGSGFEGSACTLWVKLPVAKPPGARL